MEEGQAGNVPGQGWQRLEHLLPKFGDPVRGHGGGYGLKVIGAPHRPKAGEQGPGPRGLESRVPTASPWMEVTDGLVCEGGKGGWRQTNLKDIAVT